MATIASLIVNLRGDSSSLVRASQRGLKSITALSAGVARTVFKVGALAGAITGITGGAGLALLAKQSLTSIDKIGKLGTQLGVSATEVQKLKTVAELSGLELNELSKAFQRITRLTGDWKAGGAEAGKVFARLGISLDKVQKQTPLETFTQVIGRLGKIRSATERASIGNKLFEESWQRLGPLIQGFEGDMERVTKLFDRLDLGLDDALSPLARDFARRHGIDTSDFAPDPTAAVQEINNKLTLVENAFAAFRNKMFAEMAPDLEQLAGRAGEVAIQFLKAHGGAAGLADLLSTKVAEAVKAAKGYMDELRISIGGVQAAYEAVGDFIGKSAAVAEAVVRADVTGLQSAFPGIASAQADVAGEKSVKELEQINRTLNVIRNSGGFGLVFNN